MIATKGEAISIVALSNPKAIKNAKKSLKSVTISDNPRIKSKNFENVRYVKRDLLCEFIKEGMKLCVKAPSAKIRLKRFGSLKATKNISLYMFAPRIEAVSKSRMKPNILEVKIPILLVKKDLIIMGRILAKSWLNRAVLKGYYIFLCIIELILQTKDK